MELGVAAGCAAETCITVKKMHVYLLCFLRGMINLACGHLHWLLADPAALSTEYVLGYLPPQVHSAACHLSLIVLLRFSLNVFSTYLLLHVSVSLWFRQ